MTVLTVRVSELGFCSSGRAESGIRIGFWWTTGGQACVTPHQGPIVTPGATRETRPFSMG